jgi:acyl carrier protein
MVDPGPVLQVVLEAIDEVNESLPQGQQIERSPQAVLFGDSSVLDSIGLVNLIVAIEHGISERFGVSVVLADERAMSRRTSPFRTVATLCEHVTTLLEGQVHG